MDLLTTAEISLLPFVKIAVAIGFLLYIAFAVVVVRQVKLMTATLELGHERVIKILSFVHLVFATIVFLLALVIL